MAPSKTSGIREAPTKMTLMPLSRKPISTRSHNIQENFDPLGMLTRGKRKAESNSPLKNDKIKRSALGNLTNNVVSSQLENDNPKKKNGILIASQSDISIKPNNNSGANIKKTISLRAKNEKNINRSSTLYQNCTTGIVLRGNKIITRGASGANKNNIVPLSVMHNHLVAADTAKLTKKNEQRKHHKQSETVIKPKEIYEVAAAANSKPTRRISNEFDKTEDSLYMSALEDLPSSGESVRFSGKLKPDLRRKSLSINNSENTTLVPIVEDNINNRILTPSPALKDPIDSPPDGVEDIDKESWNDPIQVSEYAMDIFSYLKNREVEFPIDDYMTRQPHLTKFMRSLLIDWMVEVQETFELNHEALYLAVKLVDIFLMRKQVKKDDLQLLGATALFIACKYDERTPPLAEDFMYVCDGAYAHKQLIRMEVIVLKTIGFDLGIPISYRFLRRYSRCIKMELPVLTLARYVLEYSLMDYATISLSDSKLACATLFIALKMNNADNTESPWNKTLEYFTGYTLHDFAYIVALLNTSIHRKQRDSVKTIRKKYSHSIFFEVAKIPLLSTEKLLENTGMLKTTEYVNN